MENQNIPEEQSTAEMLTEYAGLLWRWSWLLILLAAIAGGVAYYLAGQQKPVYRASALAMINIAPSAQDYTSVYLGQQLGTSYAQLMTTRTMLETVAKKLELPYLPASVSVTPITNTALLTVTATGYDPYQVALIANTLVTVFGEQLQVDQSARYNDSEISLVTQITEAKQQIQNTTDALVTINQKIYNTQSSLSQLNQKIADITAKSGAAAVSQDDLNQVLQLQYELVQYQPQATQLQTAFNQYQNTLFSLQQSYSQIKLSEAESSSLVILKDPAIIGIPIQASPLRSGLLAAVVGIFLGAGIVFLIEFLDDSLRDPQEITRKWGIPVLGMIVNYDSSNGNGLITEKEPRSPVSEAFRSIRTNLQFASVASPLHTLLVTSPSPEDGKTTIVGNLACVFAQVGRKVVVVDSDLRRPRLHKMFELPNRFGLTDQFIRPQEYLHGAVQTTEVKNLFLLSSGSLPPNPSELISSQRMVEVIQLLEAQYEVVFLDAPPSLVVTDANVLANHADGVILVIRPSSTKRAAIKHTIEQLAQVKANIVGVVLNGVDVKKSRYSYYRGYYHKYGRGYAYYSEDGKSGNGKRRSQKRKEKEIPREEVILKASDSILNTAERRSFGAEISQKDNKTTGSLRTYSQEKPASEETLATSEETRRENLFSNLTGKWKPAQDGIQESGGASLETETKTTIVASQENPTLEEVPDEVQETRQENPLSTWIGKLRSQIASDQDPKNLPDGQDKG